MLFLDFLCLLVCIVLLNARPIFKSMEYKNSLSRSHFKQHENKWKGIQIDSPIVLDRKKIIKRKATSNKMDLEVLDKVQTTLHSKSPIKKVRDQLKEDKVSNIIPTLTTKIFKMHQLYVPKTKINIFDNYDDSTMSAKDELEFLGTADIEAVLNDIKQREIQMIADQEPSVTNLITKAVTESSFVSEPLIKQSYIAPGYAFSTFSFVNYPNNTFTIIDEVKENKRQVHDIYDRSMKEDSYTIACNIENKLQKKLKKTYKKVKAKLLKDYNKEIKEAKASVTKSISKIDKSVSKKVCSLPSKSKTKHKTNILPNKTNGTKLNHKTTKCVESSLKKNKFSTSSPNIQTPKDNFSMLSVYEQLLDKFQANSIMDTVMLTTQNILYKKYSEKIAKRGVNTNFIQENKHSYNSDKEIPVEYTDSDNIDSDNVTAINGVTEQYDQSTTAKDESYEALSNKISYNDYVNGYKYYLNFQKSNDDDKFSNLVRYQAHKHHNVNDIGKYILKKIPELPTTRLRRYFVESETLEDQDVSTKSEDSWFKKHFFVFLDTNSPRKFHTSETVSLKAPDLVNTEKSIKTVNTRQHKPTNLQTTTTTSTRRYKRNLISSKLNNWVKYTTSESSVRRQESLASNNIKSDFQNAYDCEKEEMFSESRPKPKILTKKIRSENRFERNTPSAYRKNGFVSIDLVHRSTGLVKLNNNVKRKSKLRNFLRKFKINKTKPKVIEKRQNLHRAQRFNIFKGFKNIFNVKPNSRRTIERKVFDYEKVTSENTPESFDSMYNLKLLKVEDIMKQIPNITEDFSYTYQFLQPVNNNNSKLFYGIRPGLEMKTKSLSLLSGKQFRYSKDKNDDVFDVNIKSDESNQPKFTANMKDIHSPRLLTTLDDISQNEIITTCNQHNNLIHFNSLSKNKLYAANKNMQTIYHNSVKSFAYPKPESGEVSFSQNTINERHIFEKSTQKSLNHNEDLKTNKENTLIEKWVPVNKVQKINSKPYPFSISMMVNSKKTSKKCDHNSKLVDNSQEKAIQYNDFNFKKRIQNKGEYNGEKSKKNISSITRVNAPPKQYFTTVLPMQLNDFDKFLKDNKIDVESVTAPLLNTLPGSLITWYPKKVIAEASNQKMKIQGNVDGSQKNVLHKTIPNPKHLDSLLPHNQNQRKDLHNGASQSVNNNLHKAKEKSQNDPFFVNDKVYDRDLQLYLSLPSKDRDPLRFSHITTKDKLVNKATKKPKRIEIRGHSYKCDIIYHKKYEDNGWNRADYYGPVSATSFNDNNKDDTIFSPYKQSEIHKNKDQRLRRQRGSIQSSEIETMSTQDKTVYSEPMLRNKSKKSDIEKLKHGKRSAQEESFTAKDVAALEVVVDLFKNTEAYDGRNGNLNAFSDNNSLSLEHNLLPSSLKDNRVTNSIQVHIAFPNNKNEEKKRSLEPLRLRKVFSAIMSTPVDLVYQIHSFEETTTVPANTLQNVLTPGLYLLVEKTNITCPEGKFVLKPVKTTTSKLVMRQVNEIKSMYPSSVHEKRVSFNKDFLNALNKEIQLNDKLAHNITNSKTKRSLSEPIKNDGTHDSNIVQHYKNLPERQKMIDWESIKKHFFHDKVCHCHCKENKTMCRSCAACDAVISELIFECENLAKYMTQHCTEIQTFFWMNPSGGRKLRDVIHRIDTILNDYYRRVKGKCQGSTCQTITSNIDKRSFNNQNNYQFFIRLHELANDLENASEFKIINDKVIVSGTKFLNIAKGCLTKSLYKRADSDISKRQYYADENILYSLSNIKVNLICNKDFTKPAIISRNTIYKSFLEKNKDAGYDNEEIKKSNKNRKSLRNFLKKCYIEKKIRTKNLDQNNTIKRNWRSINQVTRPLQIAKNDSDCNSELPKTILFPSEVQFPCNKSELDTEINIKTRKNEINCEDQEKNKQTKTNSLVGLESINYNMKELVRLINNIDLEEEILSINGRTVISTTPHSQTITKKVVKIDEVVKKPTKVTIIGNKTVISEISNKKPVTLPTSKSILSINSTKTGNHKTDKPRTKNGTATSKTNLLKRLQTFTLGFLPDKYKVRCKIGKANISENRFVRSRIAKYKKHKSKANQENNMNLQDSVSTILITDYDDSILLSDETFMTKKSHGKNECLKCSQSFNPKLVNDTIQDEKVQTDGMGKISEYDDFNDIRLHLKNQSFHSKSGKQTHVTPSETNTYAYYDILRSLKNLHNNNLFNYTIISVTPKKRKGFINNIANKFVIKIKSNDKMKKVKHKFESYTTTIVQKNGNTNLNSEKTTKAQQGLLKNALDENKLSSMKLNYSTSTAATNVIKSKTGQGNRGSDLKEADEQNKVCDIAATVDHAVKLHDRMQNDNFEDYVKRLSCFKYKTLPNYIILKYKTKNEYKKHQKSRRKCRKSSINKEMKWNWIRNKRSFIFDDTRVENDDYEDSNNENVELAVTVKDFLDNSLNKKIGSKDIKMNPKFGNTGNFNEQNDSNIQYISKRSLLINSPIHYVFLSKKRDKYYETFIKGKDGIYQQSLHRRKRSDTNNISDLKQVLQNLPPLCPLTNEVFAMVGDSVSLSCSQTEYSPKETTNTISDYTWHTKRKGMLDVENIIVDGAKIFIRDVRIKNYGTYICSKGNAVIRSIKLTVTSIPKINIVFAPFYKIDLSCTYQDLKAVQKISPILRDCCGKYCSVRIYEPVCLKDRIDDTANYIRSIVVISLNPIPIKNCSSECKRNLHCSLTKLLVSDIPSLSFVKVLISFDNINKTLLPVTRENIRSYVTHTLRRKDSNGHNEFRKTAANMGPGKANLILQCPAGFYLVLEQKICVICPSNTFSDDGDNVCRICPRGTQAKPGSKSCRSEYSRSRRFAWYSNEWSVAAFCALALSAITVCYIAVCLLRRSCVLNNTCNSHGNAKLSTSKTSPKSARGRPLSPSHVILSRLLRGSMTSSRATDSQENRFELWKEKNTLPPLPPIDFDL